MRIIREREQGRIVRYGYSNHGSREPENPRKFSARTVAKQIPDPFVSS